MSKARRLSRKRDRAFRRVMARRIKSRYLWERRNWNQMFVNAKRAEHPHDRNLRWENVIRQPTRDELISDINFQEQLDEIHSPTQHQSEYPLWMEEYERQYWQDVADGLFDDYLDEDYRGNDYPAYSDYSDDYSDYFYEFSGA